MKISARCLYALPSYFYLLMLFSVYLNVPFNINYCRGEQMDSQFLLKSEIFACGLRMN